MSTTDYAPLHQKVIELLRQLSPPPANLFSGTCLKDGLSPDNIIFFHRTHASAFAPEGVSNNYHHRFELLVVFETSGNVRVGECTHQLRPGNALLVFPNQFHHYLDVQNTKLEWLFITFEGVDAKDVAMLRDSPRLLDEEAWHMLRTLLTLHKEIKKHPQNPLELSWNLARFLGHLAELPQISEAQRNLTSKDDTRDQLLEQINSYVRSNLHRKFAMLDIAESLNYSVSYLRAVFRDHLGISLGRYIRESRLSQAAHFLQTSDKSVAEIAVLCGFESQVVFSRSFKQTYGMPPKSYSQMFSALKPVASAQRRSQPRQPNV